MPRHVERETGAPETVLYILDISSPDGPEELLARLYEVRATVYRLLVDFVLLVLRFSVDAYLAQRAALANRLVADEVERAGGISQVLAWSG